MKNLHRKRIVSIVFSKHAYAGKLIKDWIESKWRVSSEEATGLLCAYHYNDLQNYEMTEAVNHYLFRLTIRQSDVEISVKTRSTAFKWKQWKIRCKTARQWTNKPNTQSVYLGNLKTVDSMERNVLELKDKRFVHMSKIIQTFGKIMSIGTYLKLHKILVTVMPCWRWEWAEGNRDKVK